ncbi:MAG TPA: LysR family transcriptional regulator [Thermoanaerobaculia bacterium]|nr:LysR family transcriptional regulator [Thermoanaerobaculia bacterium]
MDLRQLQMFRAVAEEGAFTRAAGRLHVSQSAISRQLQLLEQELGTLLLHRSAKGVTLTPHGELLLATATRIDREVQDAVAQISDTQKRLRGSLTVGGGMTVSLYVLPKLLKKFRARHKDVDLHVITGEADVLIRKLRTRQLDLALLTLPIVEEDLDVRPVMKEELVVVTEGNHPLARERSVDARTLGRYPLILFEPGSNTRRVLDEFFRDEEVPMKIAMETQNVQIIKAMVSNGLGVSLLPYSAIAGEIRTGRYAWTRVRGRHLFRETGWVFLRSEYVPRAVSEALRIFETMRKQFGGKPPSR